MVTYTRLSRDERMVIERSLQEGLSVRLIARLLGRSASTVSREVRRGGGPDGSLPRGRGCGRRRVYRGVRAARLAARRARRPKGCRLTGQLAVVVAGMLECRWSPQQISRSLPGLFPHREGWRVSHETIYQSLYVQTKGELRKELTAFLRKPRVARQPRGRAAGSGAAAGAGAGAGGGGRGRLTGMVNISARPAEAADRAVPGHWEGDLLMGGVRHGKSLGQVATLVERSSRFLVVVPLPDGRTGLDVRTALADAITRMPPGLMRSLTWDQGKEMSQHLQLTVDTGVQVYFCDPHTPWQRGTNENTNGLLRQYLPKGCDMRELTQADCDAIADELNTRPRQTLGWKTPSQVLNEHLVALAA